ncbi:hypothetical protein NM688_g8726 [Phlebia brevispora]|uniref:Uncharacterized protein n=1 Tax=Phlebia brevispora TaxID=194682 RepID=A0ACC1RQN8_9APHY|nr:hypothetical protein NM688_g8726 [Phlebia brevispora]
MIPTPDLSHLTREDYEHVYEPAEDTFILLDALEADTNELQEMKPRIYAEAGLDQDASQRSSGLYWVMAAVCIFGLARVLFLTYGSVYLTTDINVHAAQCTARTGKQNKITLDPVVGNLADPLLPRLSRNIDLLVFNPPYVPTRGEEALEAQIDADIQGAWAGGKDGMQVTDVLLDQLDDLLSPTGRFYLVAVKDNNIPGIRARMQQRHGIHNRSAAKSWS